MLILFSDEQCKELQSEWDRAQEERDRLREELRKAKEQLTKEKEELEARNRKLLANEKRARKVCESRMCGLTLRRTRRSLRIS